MTSAKISATSVTWNRLETIRGRPGRSARSAYMLERANSSTVISDAKASVSRVSTEEACQAQLPSRSTALTISAVNSAA